MRASWRRRAGVLGVLVAAATATATVACGSSDDPGAEAAAGAGGAGTPAGTGGSGAGTGTAGTGTAGTGAAGSGTAGAGTAGTGTAGAGTAGSTTGDMKLFGMPYEGGQFNLGPVDYSESAFHNACAPGTKYAPAVQQAEGTLLAGLWNGIPNVAGYCDACIQVTTAKGKSALLRVVTYGDTSTNSIDVSPDAYALLDTGEYPRAMTWQFAACASTAPMMYEFQTGSNEWWTSLWVRNARIPLTKVEVKSKNHGDYVELARGGDGTLTDGSGFGQGGFSIRSTGIDGSQVVDTFDWPAAGIAGAFLTGVSNFP